MNTRFRSAVLIRNNSRRRLSSFLRRFDALRLAEPPILVNIRFCKRWGCSSPHLPLCLKRPRRPSLEGLGGGQFQAYGPSLWQVAPSDLAQCFLIVTPTMSSGVSGMTTGASSAYCAETCASYSTEATLRLRTPIRPRRLSTSRKARTSAFCGNARRSGTRTPSLFPPSQMHIRSGATLKPWLLSISSVGVPFLRVRKASVRRWGRVRRANLLSSRRKACHRAEVSGGLVRPRVLVVLNAPALIQACEVGGSESPPCARYASHCASIVHPTRRIGCTPGGTGLPQVRNAIAQRPGQSLALGRAHPQGQSGLAVHPLNGRVVSPPLLRCKVPYPLRQIGRIDYRADNDRLAPLVHLTSRQGFSSRPKQEGREG